MKWRRLLIATVLGVGLVASAMVPPAVAQLNGGVPGSFLIFPEFNITPPAVTQLRISDVQDPALGGTTRIHLQYICPGVPGIQVCATLDRHKFTTFHGTTIIDVATDLGFPGVVPCEKGFIIAFVENASHIPISANQLIGSYRISGVDGDDATAVNAIAVQSAKPLGTLLGSIDASGELVMTFGTSPASDYVALPDVLHSDFQAVDTTAVPPKRTQLIVLTPSIKSGLPNPTANVSIHWWNQFEDEFSITKQFICWAEFELESISGLFNFASLGSAYGSLRVGSVTVPGYSPSILGVIRESSGPGPTIRRMYNNSGLQSSIYGPDPTETAAPPPPPPPPPPPDPPPPPPPPPPGGCVPSLFIVCPE